MRVSIQDCLTIFCNGDDVSREENSMPTALDVILFAKYYSTEALRTFCYWSYGVQEQQIQSSTVQIRNSSILFNQLTSPLPSASGATSSLERHTTITVS